MFNFERFFKYVKIDTTSDPNNEIKPSSLNQFNLAKVLVNDLKELGLNDICLENNGNVYATYVGNKNYKTIALVAHIDTSYDAKGSDIKPKIIKNYDGNDIKLNNYNTMKISDFPFLEEHKNHDLIVTDGTTLLGADDKAGIYIIFDVLEYIIKNNIKTGNIKVAFTTDEEVGMGAKDFNYDYFKDCDFALTLDGDNVSNIEYETFNAASVKVDITGRSTHPGSAKNKMINAISLAMQFNSMLDPMMVPEKTDNYEGFNHLHNICGTVENTSMEYIIRNHDTNLFNLQKQSFIKIKDYINQIYNQELVKLTMVDQYYNMANEVLKRKDILELIEHAIVKVGLKPKYVPIRGGTDGATLSKNGLICPNIGTGGRNYHSRYEFLDLFEANKAIEIVLNIIEGLKYE